MQLFLQLHSSCLPVDHLIDFLVKKYQELIVLIGSIVRNGIALC